jgi:predicted AAA+ superfamily ATPase
MYIKQAQLENLRKSLEPNKVVVLYGPRQCGKTTLLKKFLENFKEKYLLVQGEDSETQKFLGSQSVEKIKRFVGDTKLLIIDEAQKIDNIGLNLKLAVDQIKGLKIIATGSSSFDLAKNLGEPLVGRKTTLRLFPLSQMEISQTENLAQTSANLEERLIHGSYPKVILNRDIRKNRDYLREIVNSYLYRDIIELEGLKQTRNINDILKLIAFQIGKEVSMNELGNQLDISKNTAERYLYLLEESFVLFRLPPFSRNLRKEISKSHRYYFFDNGVRNAVINNFNPLDSRDDIGMLWEGYIINERLKKQEYKKIHSNNYFWRTYNQKEVDWVEEREGKLFGYEMKWKAKKTKPPEDWKATYKNAEYEIINSENYLGFIT